MKATKDSLPHTLWLRFRRNTPAMAGLVILILLFLVATFCYQLMPDNTTFASRHCLPICNQPAGFEVPLLRVTENKITAPQGFFSRTFTGIEQTDFQIPITSYRFDGTDVIIKEYSPAGDSGLESRFNVADVVYAINPKKRITERSGGLFFETIGGESTEESVSDMQKFIEGQYIIHKKFILGTDRYGRDLLSRLLAGTRIAFYTGIQSVLVSVCIGVLLGLLAGFNRGWMDRFISWLMVNVWSIPAMLLVIVITLITSSAVTGISLVLWVEAARIMRDRVRSLPRDGYPVVARTLGVSKLRIFFRHILPGLTGTLLFIAVSNFSAAVLLESGLSFLSVQDTPDYPSWGRMIRESYAYVVMPGSAHLTLLPGIALVLLVSAALVVGKGIRQAMGSVVETSVV